MQEKTGILDACIQQGHILAVESFKGPLVQRGADALHQAVIKIEVMHHGKAHAQHLVRLEQMAQVGAAEIAAYRAVAQGVDGVFVPFILQVFDIDHAAPGVQMAMARIAAGHHAVEQVHAAPHALQDIARRADPHQITDPVFGHKGLHRADDAVHLLGWLAHRQPADGIPVQLHLRNALHVFHPQVLKGAALVDAEQKLLRVDRPPLGFQAGQLRLAAGQPAGGALAAGFGIVVLRRVLHTLVKGHGNGGAEVCLNAHALLGPHKDFVAVQVGVKGHALFGDVPQLCQAEDLKAAAVGKNGAVPPGKAVQPTQFGHQAVARAQVQMIGVAQHHLAADLFQIERRQAALDGGGGGHVHERRGLHGAVHGTKLAPARRVFSFEQTVSHVKRYPFFPMGAGGLITK